MIKLKWTIIGLLALYLVTSSGGFILANENFFIIGMIMYIYSLMVLFLLIRAINLSMEDDSDEQILEIL